MLVNNQIVNKQRGVKSFLRTYFEENQPATYYYKEVNKDKYDIKIRNKYYILTSVHCGDGKKRSFTDLYDLLKFRFPKTTTKKLIAKYLIEFSKEKIIRGRVCITIKEPVFNYAVTSYDKNDNGLLVNNIYLTEKYLNLTNSGNSVINILEYAGVLDEVKEEYNID